MSARVWTFEEVEAMYRRLNPGAIDGSGCKVVVAEDMLPMRMLLVNALTKKGFTVLPVENGLQALRLIRDKQPDCVLLDLMLPQMGGFEILEALKKDERYASIPILICSARKEARDIVTARKLGAAGYITKPFQIEEVLRRVEELCR